MNIDKFLDRIAQGTVIFLGVSIVASIGWLVFTKPVALPLMAAYGFIVWAIIRVMK